MNESPLPAWNDRDELLRFMTGDWQVLSQPLSQQQMLLLSEYVSADLVQFRFEVEVSAIDDPNRILRFDVVASGDYGRSLVPTI